MPANTTPVYTLTPNIGLARPAAANTASDGSGTCPTVFTAGANGSICFRVRYFNAQATAAASSAMVVRLFVTDTAGANPSLIAEAALAAATRSVSAIGAYGMFTLPGAGIALASGALLKVVQSVYAGAQDLVVFVAEGGDF